MTAEELMKAARSDHRFGVQAKRIFRNQTAISYEKIAQARIAEIPNPLYQILLYRKGILGEQWIDISSDLNYSKRQLYRFYNAALAQLQFVLDNDPVR